MQSTSQLKLKYKLFYISRIFKRHKTNREYFFVIKVNVNALIKHEFLRKTKKAFILWEN